MRYYKSMKKTNNGFNFKLPSFWKGFASIFDISGQTLIEIPDLNTGFQRDVQALRGDWQRIGNDIRKAMDMVAHAQ